MSGYNYSISDLQVSCAKIEASLIYSLSTGAISGPCTGCRTSAHAFAGTPLLGSARNRSHPPRSASAIIVASGGSRATTFP